MADERASITIAVNDEASAKLKEISDQLESIYKKASEASRQATESAKAYQEAHNKNRQGFRETEEAGQRVGQVIRNAFTETTKAAQGLGFAIGPVTKGLQTAAEVGKHFALAIGGANLAVGGIIAAGAAAAAGMYLLSRSFTDAYQKAENFRRLSLMDQGTIDRLTKARELVGMTAEQAQSSMLKLNNMMRDLATKGPQAEMARIAREQMGPGWSRAINELQTQMQRGVITWQQAKDKLLDYIAAQKDPEVRRAAYEFWHIDPIEVERREEIKRHEKDIIGTSKEMTEAQKRLAEQTDKTTIAFGNLATKVMNAIGPTAYSWLEKFMAGLEKTAKILSGDIKPPAPPPPTPEEQNRADWYARRAGRGRRGTPYVTTPGLFEKPSGIIPGPGYSIQKFGDFGGADFGGISEESKAALINNIMTPENIARGGRHVIDLRGSNAAGGMTGEPIVINKLADEQRQSTDYLREIRDVMEWIRQTMQTQGGGQAGGGTPGTGTGGGGTGFGGRLGGFAGGGGGAARTGSPWFGGRAGRGTGGFPGNMPQGQAGSGQDFYNQALAQVKASGLVGQVPPDGRQFGITTGSAEEWARFMTGVAKAESNFNPRSTNLQDEGGSYGVLQYSHQQVPGGNAYDTNASIQAFIRDAQQAMRSGGIRSPASLLRRRFSTIGSHPERTIRNLVNYGAPSQAQDQSGGQGAAQGGGQQGGGVTTAPGVTGGSSPGYVSGTVSLGGETFHWGSGGGGAGSIPSGTFPINFGDIGNVGRQIGSIAGLGGPSGTIYDPRLGRNRVGIQIHPNTHGSDLDRLYTAGCFSIPQNEWPRFRAKLLEQAQRNPGGLFLQVNRNGQAIIGPRTDPRLAQPAPTQQGPRAQANQRSPGSTLRSRGGGGDYGGGGATAQYFTGGQDGDGAAAPGVNLTPGRGGQAGGSNRRLVYADGSGGATISLAKDDDIVERLLREQLAKPRPASRLGTGSQGEDAARENVAAGRHFWQLDQEGLRRSRGRTGGGTQGEAAAAENVREGRPFWQLGDRGESRRRKRAPPWHVTGSALAGEHGGADRTSEDVAADARERRNKASRLDVNVSAPKGTKVNADGGDVFDNVKIRQQAQMSESHDTGEE